MAASRHPFACLPELRSPELFAARVHQRIVFIERRRSFERMTALVGLSAVSLGAFFGSCAYAWQAMVSSGFVQYVSLAISDASVFAHSKQLVLSLAESLPAFGIALALSAALISVGSIWSFWRQFRSRKSVGIAFA